MYIYNIHELDCTNHDSGLRCKTAHGNIVFPMQSHLQISMKCVSGEIMHCGMLHISQYMWQHIQSCVCKNIHYLKRNRLLLRYLNIMATYCGMLHISQYMWQHIQSCVCKNIHYLKRKRLLLRYLNIMAT